MANLEKTIKVTQAQYDILAAGGTIGSYTGLNDKYIYLIVDTNTYITSNGGTIDGDNLTLDGVNLEVTDGNINVTNGDINIKQNNALKIIDNNGNVKLGYGGVIYNEAIYIPESNKATLLGTDEYNIIFPDYHYGYQEGIHFNTHYLWIGDDEGRVDPCLRIYDRGCFEVYNEEYDTTYTIYLPDSSGTLATYTQVNARIPKSTLTTTGDILYASAASTPARLGIGTNGQVLTSSSSGIPEWTSLGTAASKAYTTSVTSGSNDLVTSGAVWTAIDNLAEPMVFKGTLGTGGTITDLPAAASSNEGFTYKVITDGTYASQAAKVGDVFISNGSAWTLVPSGDEPSGTVTNVATASASGSHLTLTGGPITSSGTITVGVDSGYSIPSDSKQSDWDAKYDKPSTGIPATDLEESYYLASNPSGYITGINSSDVTTALGYTPVNPSSLASVATSGDYTNLSNKPLSSISISQTSLPGTGSRPQTTTTSITLDGTTTDIVSHTVIDSSLSSSSKNPVANDVLYNAISNKIDAEDFQELEHIALTTNGILTGEPLTPIATIIDGNYYPSVSDSNQRWKMGKSDSATYFKIYDVDGYTSVHLKSVSRAGHILTDTAPSDFVTKIHQNPSQVANWYEAASVSDSEQADVLPKTGYTPYDKDLTINGKHYLIVYEVNAAQAIEVINGSGYSPIYTSMFVNDGDGLTTNDPYAKMSDIPTVNNATLTITQNSTSAGTFTANASSNVTIDIVTPKVERYI